MGWVMCKRREKEQKKQEAALRKEFYSLFNVSVFIFTTAVTRMY